MRTPKIPQRNSLKLLSIASIFVLAADLLSGVELIPVWAAWLLFGVLAALIGRRAYYAFSQRCREYGWISVAEITLGMVMVALYTGIEQF